jgi:histidinol-phosphatase
MALEKELALAREICAEAGAIQLAAAREHPSVTLKSDHSPVTEVDRRCEAHIRERLAAALPSDGLLGEEGSRSEGTSGRRWIIDPLDGTRPFVRGIPTYSVLLALEDHGEPVVGVMRLPAMGLECWGSAGSGAFVNGERVHVSATATMDRALGAGLGFVEHADRQGERLLSLMRTWDFAYGFMDAYTYVAVVAGKLDLCVNLLDQPWDCAAAIVREAGGRFSDISGKASVHNGSFVISNGLLHDQALAPFRGQAPRNKRSART